MFWCADTQQQQQQQLGQLTPAVPPEVFEEHRPASSRFGKPQQTKNKKLAMTMLKSNNSTEPGLIDAAKKSTLKGVIQY
jgi:hypothetical protein